MPAARSFVLPLQGLLDLPYRRIHRLLRSASGKYARTPPEYILRGLALFEQPKFMTVSEPAGSSQNVPGCGFGPRLCRIDCIIMPEDDELMKRVLDIWTGIGNTVEPCQVCFVFREEEPGRFSIGSGCRSQAEPAQRGHARLSAGIHPLHRFLALASMPPPCAPPPGIAKPQGWQDVEYGSFRAAVGHREPDQNIIGGLLTVFCENVKVTIFFENTGIHQFEFRFILVPFAVFGHELSVRKFLLRILVEGLAIGVNWS